MIRATHDTQPAARAHLTQKAQEQKPRAALQLARVNARGLVYRRRVTGGGVGGGSGW